MAEIILVLLLLVIPVASQSTTAGNRGLVDLSRYVKDGRCAYTFIMPDQNESPCNGEYDQALQRLSDRIDHLEKGKSSYPLLNTTSYPVDCQHAYILNGNKLQEGVHVIQPQSYPEPFPVYCEVQDDGAWTVVQRRKDGSITFKNEWQSYKYGFGQITGEHWLGNEKMYHLLRTDEYKLRIDLQNWEGNSTYAEYDLFRVGNEAKEYALWLGEYSGTAGDSMGSHATAKFSTKDNYSYGTSSSCCACYGSAYRGGWWFLAGSSCYQANLNGHYYTSKRVTDYGIAWKSWQNTDTLKETLMKVKRLRN